jgi:NDP-sugar pyrophosphorylase family protein
LIPIGDRSVLEVIIDKFLQYRVEQFYLAVNHKAKIIKSYFEEIHPAYHLEFLEEEKPLGTVGALKKLEGRVSGEIFLTNCDIIIDADYADILHFHRKNNNDLTLVASMKNYHIPYGICNIEKDGVLVKMTEKPEYNFLVNTGMYIINSDILSFIPENEFFHITHLIEKVKDRKKIGVYPISENAWTDVGEWIEYKKAVEKIK